MKISVILGILGCALVTLVVALYVATSPRVATSFWNQYIFFPTNDDHPVYHLQSIQGCPVENLSIKTSHDATVHALFFKQPRSEKVAILSHGNAGHLCHRLYVIETLLQSGVSVLAYDYQGFGQSTGTPSVEGICEDGTAVYNYAVHQLGYRGKDIILVGESLGCGVSAEVARNHECAAIILQSGFASIPQLARERVELCRVYPDNLYPQPILNTTANLREIHVPVLIIHGSDDELIPCSHATQNYEAANKPKSILIVEGANHNDCQQIDPPAYKHAYATFISSLGKKQLAAGK